MRLHKSHPYTSYCSEMSRRFQNPSSYRELSLFDYQLRLPARSIDQLIVVDGIVREGVLSINHAWDFFSEKDGEIHHFDLCEPCYDAVISEFKLPVDVEEQKE